MKRYQVRRDLKDAGIPMIYRWRIVDRWSGREYKPATWREAMATLEELGAL